MTLTEVKKLNIPGTPGSYQFYNKKGELIYIGKAVNLKNRVLSYWQKGTALTPAKQQMITEIEQLKWIEVDSEIEALLLEANLVKKFQPEYNVMLRDDKRFMYINISLEDEVPGVFATRHISKTGKYFGPFISTAAVRETLKAIRKIWPYCTQRKISARPCFYYQIGRCLGVCGSKVSLAEYKRAVIKPIILFLEGKKNKIITNYELKIKNFEKKINRQSKTVQPPRGQINTIDKDVAELAKLKWQLKNMQQVLANAQVLSVGDKYANDVVELAKVLNLPKVPERIEGYDLSNIFGRAAVGSMVVFAGGEPDKNEYRKFKIKNAIKAKHGDVQMLAEVLERRFKHSVDPSLSLPLVRGGESKDVFVGNVTPLYQVGDQEGVWQQSDKNKFWPLPDLIIVDGGKAQLNAALKVLQKFKLTIPIIGISKGEGLRSAIAPDKLFFPGQKLPLELSLNSPALHLIKRVRDEAHRFAITYHRQLRSKAMFH